MNKPVPTIALHAGAGHIRRDGFAPDEIPVYRKALAKAVNAGAEVLAAGGTALDAVCATVMVLEDDPLFNAGRGAVFTHEGTHEMDACLMNGIGREAGAVVGVSKVVHPILAARAVMEKTGHVMLAGRAAEELAEKNGLEMAQDDQYFFSERRWNELQRALHTGKTALSEDVSLAPDRKFGTVGAVAVDADGNIAAATSTGGMTNKMSGRIGDSPVVGAGTYADNRTCAISCTGHGEYFIRSCVAHDVAARMRYLNEPLQTAVDTVLKETSQMGGTGGLVSIDAKGNVVFGLEADGMYRAVRRMGESARVAIFGDEEPSEP